VASLDLEGSGADLLRVRADTTVIARELLGVAALVASAIVPLWAARAILRTILSFLKWRETSPDVP
jgi:hypothetical protein